VKILPFVYSSAEKKHERFLLLLETDHLEDLGSLGGMMNGTNIMEINGEYSSFCSFKIAVTVFVL